MRKTAAKLLTAAALATSLVTVASGTALADPTVVPATADIVGVGSDTTQTVLNQFSTDYNAYLTGLGDTTSPRLYSFDATGSATITAKAGTTAFTRPNGSGAGILKLNETAPVAPVDFARSSRGPQSPDVASDIFVAFAKDAVTWSAKSTGSNAPANLTTADLKGIYSGTITTWNQITDIPGYTGPAVAIKAFLPQASSGTRSFFLKAIGVTTVGTTIITGPEENEGTDSALNDANAIFPYSVGHYIGQVYGGHSSGSDAAGVLSLRNVNGVVPITAGNTINPVFANPTYGRVLYNVVRNAEWTAATVKGTALRNIFSSTGWICTNGAADIASYGFLVLPGAACGSTTHI
jgi:ABC-type phosphate transport system substrate-binding protein